MYHFFVTSIYLKDSLPWLLILPESIRWLTIHGQWDKARKEINRAAKVNFLLRDKDFDSKIDQYFDCVKKEVNILSAFICEKNQFQSYS